MNRKSVEKLLKNEIHEYRFIALIILTIQFNEGNKEEKRNNKILFRTYATN